MHETGDDQKPEDSASVKPGGETLEAPMEAKLKTYKGTARLGQDIQAKIGQQLRAMYADVVDQGVPQRFVDLVRRMGEPSKKEGE